MGMSEQLKPCPFCGGSPVIKAHENAPIGIWAWGENPYYYSVGCANAFCGVSFSGFNTIDEALEKWNRRDYE